MNLAVYVIWSVEVMSEIISWFQKALKIQFTGSITFHLTRGVVNKIHKNEVFDLAEIATK